MDVIEEIARFRLDDVPFTLPARREMFGTLSRDQVLRRRVEDALVGLGFTEVYTPSLLPDDETPWRLPDPISVELSALRTSLIPSLVEAARRNLDAGARCDRALRDRACLPAGRRASRRAPARRGHRRGWLPAPQGGGRVASRRAQGHSELPRAPAIRCCIPARRRPPRPAILGELHPRQLDGAWGVFELDLADLFAHVQEPVTYLDVISYPAVRQDLALVVDEQVSVGELVALAREAAGAELREVDVFDVYRGEQVPAGSKSVALALSFQSAERTLTEEDASALRGAIVTAAGERFGARLRGA